MKYNLLMIFKRQSILMLVFILSLIVSCKPEDNIKNPANYELYISISADKTPAVSPDGNLIAYTIRVLKSQNQRITQQDYIL
jgi:hypothetical protein